LSGRAESHHLRHPFAPIVEGRSGAVGTGRRDNLIFHDVTVRHREQSLREPAASAGRPRRYDVRSQQQIRCIRGFHSAAAAQLAGAGPGHERVHGIGSIKTAIFNYPDVRSNDRSIKRNRNGVRARPNVFCIVDGLR
jgi:hypothetical protein